MARYTGPVCRLCRREGVKLFLKGEKCVTKCTLERRPTPPGQATTTRRRTKSEFGAQLREKQKLRRYYGVLEAQFEKYFIEAERRGGVTGDNLMTLLEGRLDNVVYRLGMGRSRPEARQLVRHGHFHLNGHRADIPSMQVKVGDVVALTEKSRQDAIFAEIVETNSGRPVPEWLSFERENFSGRVLSTPRRPEGDLDVQDQLIVQYYSRRI